MSSDDDVSCALCNDALPDDGCIMSCTECKCQYHLGDCSGISVKVFKSKNDSFKGSWKCRDCKKQGSQKGQQKKEHDIAVILAGINEKLASLMALKETVESIEKSQQLIAAQYDDILKQVNQHDNKIADLHKRLERVEHLERKQDLQSAVHDLEWRSRKLNLEIHGIAQTVNEDLLCKLNELATRLEIPPLNESEITDIHRLPSRADRVPGIIIRFARQSTRELWLEQKKKLRGVKPNVYIQENMTKRNRELLSAAKEWRKRAEYKYVWHKNGSVLVRKTDGERAVVIRCEDDLIKIA